MNTLLATDVRLMTMNGKYYLYTAFGSILIRYAEAFGPVTLICREVAINELENGHIEVSEYVKKAVTVSELNDSLLPSFIKRLEDEITHADLVVVRAPSIIATQTARIARKIGKPYLAEAMGDAWDANWNHSISGKCIAPIMLWQMKKLFAKADFGLYVTSEFLQNRYPCYGINEGISNVRIQSSPEFVLHNRLQRIDASSGDGISLMTTAAVNVRFKGQEYMIKAMKKLACKGISATYYLAGGGDQQYLKKIAEQEGVSDKVVFLGHLTRDQVMDYLDQVDLYVQPSLQEGLPRSVIEAMSRGCPCIGARTAGIPELLEDRFVVKRKDSDQLAEAVLSYVSLSAEEKKQIATRNFEEAKKYESDKLDRKRNAFFEQIKEKIRVTD